MKWGNLLIPVLVVLLAVYMLFFTKELTRATEECTAKGGVLLSRDNVCVKKL